MRKFFRCFLGVFLLAQLQGCYTQLRIPERKEPPAVKKISFREKAIQELFERPFNPDMELLGSRWEHRTQMMDGGDEVDRISFGQNDQLAFSQHNSPNYIIAGYRIFSDTLFVVFENSTSIDKYLCRINEDRLELRMLSRPNNEDMCLVGWSSSAVFNRIIR